jgi:anthranilate phosphoribosyltransferase
MSARGRAFLWSMVCRQITPDSGASAARSMRASDANLPTADHFELDNIGPVQVCVPSGNGHTGMGGTVAVQHIVGAWREEARRK